MIGSAGLAAGVARPLPFTGCVLAECQRSARYVWASGPLARVSGHLVDLCLPPRPHFAFGSISIGALEQHAGDTDDSSCVVTEITFGQEVCAEIEEFGRGRGYLVVVTGPFLRLWKSPGSTAI